MIDRFSREEFEAAIPAGRWITGPNKGHEFWTSMGIVNGEFQYVMRVNDLVFIMIRSSVRPDGFAAETGADSIRCWLVDENHEPLANKVQAYVTRAPGWQARMVEVLRTLWRKGYALPTCCSRPMVEFRVRKDATHASGLPSLNRGRLFRKCRVCGRFEWVMEVK
jgi:hypothetical protein